MWWIIVIVAIVILVMHNVKKDYNSNVKEHITNQGGMLTKYQILIDYLRSSGMSVQEIGKDYIVLSSKNMTWHLNQIGMEIEIRVKGFIPTLGNIENSWKYSEDYPQQKMVEEIENYLTWQMRQFQKAMKNNPYEHLNNN